MSVYNGERFLREAVESVLTQTMTDFELVVVDDGSADSTPQILAQYAASDPRVVIHRQRNRGRAVALNRAVAAARAAVIARMDADDVSVPDRLERQHRFMLAHRKVAAVGGAVTFVDARSRPFGQAQYPLTDAEIRQALGHTTALPHPGVMLRKEAFDRAGRYRPCFAVAEDLDLWLRMDGGDALANLPDPVIRYRIYADQETVRRSEQHAWEEVAARTAARERRAGRPDPLQTISGIDRDLLIALGASEHDIVSAHIQYMTWLAKTMGRAGDEEVEERLFAAAHAEARSPGGSASLRASVLRARSRRHAEEGRPLRARVELLRARLTEAVGR
jgi:glycosyltransferase involved in cell wall biosynthesis